MANNVHEFNESNWQAEVLEAQGLVMVDFWAEWCAPCKALTPIIHDVATKAGAKVKVGKVDTVANPGLSASMGVMSIPAILFFKDGKVVKQLVGYQPADNFLRAIDDLAA
jgi:thioredoxin 1